MAASVSAGCQSLPACAAASHLGRDAGPACHVPRPLLAVKHDSSRFAISTRTDQCCGQRSRRAAVLLQRVGVGVTT